MREFIIPALGFGLLVLPAWCQSSTSQARCIDAACLGSEPSPMEAFASSSGVREVWSSQVAQLKDSDVVVVIAAIVLQAGGASGQNMRGLKIDLSAAGAHDRIYLDETAVKRTIAALDSISTALAHSRLGGCTGAAEFWPNYNWEWNKYHELNAQDYGSGLVLQARGRRESFGLSTETASSVARLLANGLDQLKQR